MQYKIFQNVKFTKLLICVKKNIRNVKIKRIFLPEKQNNISIIIKNSQFNFF